MRALSSVGSERLPYKQRVGGSNPSAPTSSFRYSCDMTFVVLQVFYINYFCSKTQIYCKNAWKLKNNAYLCTRIEKKYT